MQIDNSFRVDVPVDEAWTVLLDLERIAPCLPGALLQEIEGDVYRGVVKVKVGPITAQYKGAATFTSKDDAAHVAVLTAEGRETRGQGNASATITATLVADGDGTKVTVITDLTVTGKVAQFGRGVMADVSAKLLNQFVQCLETTVLGSPQQAPEEPKPAEWPTDLAAAAPEVPETPPADKPEVRRISSPEPQPVNLLDTAGAPVAKRVGPVVAVLAIAWLLRVLLRRRRRRS
jgi:carbon monoxide dehydrogenase subunit G